MNISRGIEENCTTIIEENRELDRTLSWGGTLGSRITARTRVAAMVG